MKDKSKDKEPTMNDPADIYRALLVMRADFDMLGAMAKDESMDAVVLRRMIAMKAADSEKLMTDLSVVRSRFAALESLGMAAPVPPELLSGDMEGAEREVFKRLRALRLEVPAEVASDVYGCVSSCLAGYRVRLQKAQAEVEQLKAESAEGKLMSMEDGDA